MVEYRSWIICDLAIFGVEDYFHYLACVGHHAAGVWGLIPIGIFCYVLTKNELNLIEDSFFYQTECIFECTQKFDQVLKAVTK